MMKRQIAKFLFASMAALLMGSFGLVNSAYAAPGGGGGGKGGGGGGGGGDDSGTPPDYGDLVVLYRDASGFPILTNDTDLCQQPIAFESDTCTMYATFDCVEFDTTDGTTCLTRVVPVDPLTCAITVAGCTHEIEFGRANSARSPASVFEAQLEDVVVKLATADQIGLDPSGRLVACVDGGVDADELPLPDTSSAVDSPLQNLAIYKQLMTVGYLGDEGQIILPASAMDTAARGVGVAVDKGGKVTVDMLVYLNQIMGLSDLSETILGPPHCMDVREEVMGNIETVQKCFLDYGMAPGEGGPAPYAYGGGGDSGRQSNFENLPLPPYINGGIAGDFEVLEWTLSGETFGIFRGPIFERVFRSGEGNGNVNIGGFVKAADDTREVINYMHSWPLPVEYVAEDGTVTSFLTPVTCGDSGGTGYDLSISADSGLQVPVQMVPNDEGREFIVTIANAGPDVAEGSVWVTADAIDTVVKIAIFALDENGDPILDPEGNPVVDEWVGGPFEFPFTDLAKGSSASWTSTFIVDPARKTTINWTATIVADFDVNSMNNTVYETTNVIQTGKGGGRR